MALMIQKSLNQSQLARMTNVAQSTISGYMKGNRLPGADELARLSTALGVSMDYLWGTTEQKPENNALQQENMKLRAELNHAVEVMENAIKQIKKDH